MPTVEITYRYETGETPARPRPMDSAAARGRLNDGNRSFARLLDGLTTESGPIRHVIPVDPRDLGLLSEKAGAPSQHPFAVILGCSDARVPVELIFSEGPNDVFVVRVAGNVLGAEVLGSVRYAVEQLSRSLKLIVVLGHSGCGGVATAVNVFLSPEDYLSFAAKYSLRSILDRLLVVVQACARKLVGRFGPDVTQHPGYRKALIEAAIVANAALSAFAIQQELGKSDFTGVEAAYGVYLLETREIWTPVQAGKQGTGLAAAPRDLEEFFALSDAIANSERIASFLKPKG